MAVILFHNKIKTPGIKIRRRIKMKKILLQIMLTALFIGLSSGFANAQRYWNTAAKVSGDKYLAVTPGSGVSNISSDYTLECWFNASTSNNATLFGKNAFRLLLDNAGGGYLRARIQVNGQTKAYSSYSGKFSTNNWYHLIVYYDSADSQFSFYINGNYDTNRVLTGNQDPSTGNDTLFIGSSGFGTGEVMIDDIRIWNRRIDINTLNKLYRTTFVGESNADNLVFSANFDNPVTGPFGSLYTAGQGGNMYNRGAEPVNLGKNPSMGVGLNTAVDLDGVNDYVRMETHPDIEFTGAMTVEFWVNPDTLGQTFNYMVAKKNSGTGWGVYFDSGNVRIQVNSTTLQLGSGSFIPPRKWTHVAFTKPAGTGMKVYINGIQTANNTTMPPPNPSSDSLYIGRNPGTSSTRFKGYIDAVKLSNYEKTSDEIKRSVFEVTDNSNAPSAPFKIVCINFDYHSIDNEYRAFNGDNYELMFGAVITKPYLSSASIPVSPIMGANIPGFPEGYSFKYSGNRIPESNSAGFMRTDSIYVSNNMNISDINLFLALNHEMQSQLEITLLSPSGDSLRIWNRNYGIESRDHIITVFDDQADSMLVNDKYLDFGPRIKPLNSLNTRFAGENAAGYWKLKITDFDNNSTGWLYAWGVQVNEQVLVSTENINAEVPQEYKLEQNYPNPFNPSTTIKFSIPVKGIVKLKVFDMLGKEVAVLINKEMSAGNYNIDFTGAKLSSGVYFYKLETEAFTDVKKMLLVK
jgi:subtilisin-like proprotein convertase family protein